MNLPVLLIFSGLLLIDIGLTIFIWRFKKNGPDYQGLYKKSLQVIQSAKKALDDQTVMNKFFQEQIIWHTTLLEELMQKYDVSREEMHEIIKKTNEQFGYPTLSFKELDDVIEEIKKRMTEDGKLGDLGDLGNEDVENFFKGTIPMKETPNREKTVIDKIILDMDIILDKVSKKGEKSLTTEELDFLKKQGNK